MPGYSLVQDKNHGFGLNTRLREDQLPPGKAVVADNVQFRNYTREERPGYSPVLVGTKDDVLRGGPPGSSLYVRGHRPYLVSDTERSTFTAGEYRPFNYNERHGVIVCPEGDHSNLRLDVESGDTDWAIDFTLWSDQFNPSIYNRESTGSYWRPIIVAAKGDENNTQWAIRIVMDGADITAEPKFRVVLTLYESAVHTYATTPAHTQAQDFYYDDGSGNKGWFVVGKRMWFGFSFSNAGATITSHYKLEGGSVVSGSAVAISTSAPNLRGNGTQKGSGDNDLPLMIGKRCVLLKHGSGASHGIAEEGWNGVLGEFRLWGASQPTWSSWAYTESEIPDSELDDSSGTVSGDNDLELYYSFADQYRQESTNLSKLDPRYTTGTTANNTAFLSGGDGTWVTGSGKLGSYGLQLLPDYGIGDKFRNIFGVIDDRDWMHTSAPGIRIPNGNSYLEKVPGTTADGQYRLPEELSVLVTFKILTDGDNLTFMHLVHMGFVGTSSAGTYVVEDLFDIQLQHLSGSWKLQTVVNNGPAVASSSALTIGQEYTAVVTLQWEDASLNELRVRQYIDGTLDGTSVTSGGSGRPATLSEDTQSTAAGDNENDTDLRRNVYPFAIGYKHRYTSGTIQTSFFGAPEPVGGTGGLRDWAFYGDGTPATPNSGIHHKGHETFRGVIGSVGIWHKALSQPEIDRFVDRGPTPEEIASYGALLRSYWDMEEGQGNILLDKGHNGNHLRVNPYPEVKSVAGPVARRQKSIITGFWENRPKTPREKAVGREIYAIAGGSVCRLAKDSSGDYYLSPISNAPNMQSVPTPSAFQFSDFLYICNGVGLPLRISQGKVSHAGLSPVFGEGVQHDNLGYLEHDRDGTFQLRVGSTAGATSSSAFPNGRIFFWAITYYDPEAAVESAPSRLMKWTVQAHANEMILDHLPRSHSPNGTVIRIYRTRANGNRLLFVDEIPATQDTYTDDKLDTQLGSELDTYDNFPPPQGSRFAIRLGGRVIYSGVDRDGASIFPSKVGNPEACPPQYQVSVSEGRSARVTGMLSMHDRGLVFLQDTAFIVSDQGGDVGVNSLVSAPISVEKIKDAVGCVEHATIVTVDDLGGIFAGERGLYVTDGFNFKYVSEEIEGTWQSLNKSTYGQWIAVHWRKNDQYLLACRRASGEGRNDTVVVWDYARSAFSVFDGLEVKFWQVIEDEDTGQNRLYFSDHFGQLWEWDSQDAPVHNDGASRTGFTALTGTVQSGSTTSNVKLFASSTLPTGGDGLRGVALTIGHQTRRIIWNDGTNVELETALTGSPPNAGLAWSLGGITSKWKSGFLSMGTETTWKRVTAAQFNFEPRSGGSCDLSVGYETNNVANKIEGVDANVHQKNVPAIGRGRKVQCTIESSGPDNPWEVTDIEIKWLKRGEASWLA